MQTIKTAKKGFRTKVFSRFPMEFDKKEEHSLITKMLKQKEGGKPK
jgi:hypothetical protein